MSFKINKVEFIDVSFAFDGEDRVLENTSFNFPLGEVVSLRGERGSGRSTLLQLLAGLQMPTQGRFEINGENVLDMRFDEFLPYRLKIGYTFDLGGLLSNRTIRDNLLLPLQYHKLCSAQEAVDRVDYYLERFSLMKSKDVRPANVSGSVRKLACLLRSLLIEPEVLLLDDLTVGLSRPVVEDYWGCLEELRKGGKNHTIIFSSYDESFAQQVETAVVYLEGCQLFQDQVEKRVASL
jgi:ABC-type multidrug transport system ATPase subunit